MVLKLYSVYDSKSETYDRPWVSKTRGEAIRAFSDALKDSNTMVGKYPGDFSLWELGEYDDNLGLVIASKAKQNLGVGVDFISGEGAPSVLKRNVNDE